LNGSPEYFLDRNGEDIRERHAECMMRPTTNAIPKATYNLAPERANELHVWPEATNSGHLFGIGKHVVRGEGGRDHRQ
jgi:hypothetical protein